MTVTAQDIMAIVESGEYSLDTKGLTTSASLRQAGLDSLDASLLFLTVQEKYGVKVSDKDVIQLDSVDAIAAFVNERLT